MRISLTNFKRSFSAEPGQSLLDAALAAGVKLPHSCNSGNCGVCRARLHEGSIRYPFGSPLGLSAAEAADGLILMCQAQAVGDVLLEAQTLSTPEHALVKRLPCRIERSVPLAHDVLALYLRLPAAEPFSFAPGQYIDILLDGGRRRSFSIASPPHDSRLLELHVRRVRGGELTESLFAREQAGTLLSIEGPLGRFIYRGATSDPVEAPPMLLIGGGTGLAPLLSIMRHVVETGLERAMTLYWGVRSEADLYAHSQLQQMATVTPYLRYRPVLSEPSSAWVGARGWVHEVALREVAALPDHEVYASGPPEMIAAVRRDFSARGVAASRLYVDSFDYAPDAWARQRLMAATKS